MRKFTDFIINKRYLILVLFIILSIISVILSNKVNINYEIAEYLPSTSETRIGMDIMEDKFKELNTSNLNVMFNGLGENEKNEIYDYLSNIECVSSVDYDNTENYNKDGYTLYKLNIDDTEDSTTAKNLYGEVTEHYKDYEMYTSGGISEKNTDVLPTWIVVLAVGCALIILIIMCESYVEPFLFLASILIAVLLNNGTNIIFDSVSNITSSISAILQMALSMDYSIMLMNRYQQEKEKETDKVKAMKNALYNAFKSISSSSVTTIVGLIALVFMSFTIGRDLGFVLAKGVLFSLISIFFVLPALILMFDKLITKTKKKSPNIKLNKLGKISYKLRHVALFLFVGAFIFSYLSKGNLGILYTDSESNKISEVFGEDNQIAIIYKNEDEEKVAKHLSEIENKDKVDEVLGYGNTINEELTYNKLNVKLNDLGSDVKVDEYLLKILYYNYYNQDENNRMTFNEFVTFVQNDVYNNKEMSEKIDDETKANIERLKNFTSSDSINQKRTASEIASILEINESDVNDILIYYNSKNNNNIKISLNDFIKFMNKDVFTNEKYSKNIDENTKNDLNKLANFTNTNTIKKKMTSKEMANLFGIDENVMKDLYMYYVNVNELDTKMSISQFANFVLTDVATNKNYANLFDDATLKNINILATFSNANTITKNMNSAELANLLGIDENLVKQLLLLNYKNTESTTKLSISELINNVVYIKENTSYLDNVDLSSLQKLSVFAQNQNNINTTKMDKTNLSAIFNNISNGLVDTVYAGASLPDDYLMTPQEFINFVLENFSDNMDQATVKNLTILKNVIDDSTSSNKTKYTSSEISNLLGIEKSKMYEIYALIDFCNGNTSNWKMTPNNFVKFILQNSNNENIKNSMDESIINQLTLLSNIMESSINKKTYTYKQIAEFIGIDSNTTKNIYTLYVSNKNTTKLTPQEFVNFVLKNKNTDVLSSNLNSSTISELTLVQSAMEGALNNKKYTSNELGNLLGINVDDLNLLYGLYYSKYVNPNQLISLKEFVEFILNDVITNSDYSSNFDEDSKSKLTTINGVMNATLNNIKYTKEEIFAILSEFTQNLDKNTIDLLYVYYGSTTEYNDTWTLTVEEFVNYLNENILTDSRFDDFIKDDMRQSITESKTTVNDAKELLIGDGYSRIVINTSFNSESDETFNFIQELKDNLGADVDEFYIIGDSPMAYEMSKTFQSELDFITILTMIAIFIVVAITFKSLIIPMILVILIQCAVYMTMGILSFSGEGVYFISILIVQSILMGATIDYAILYTSYYLEHRRVMDIKESIINSYNKSIHTILTSASILIIVTLIVGNFASAIAAKICKTISQGTLCSALLILILLPAMLGACDKIIIKKKKQ